MATHEVSFGYLLGLFYLSSQFPLPPRPPLATHSRLPGSFMSPSKMPVFSSRIIVPKGTRISRSSALGLVFALPCPRVPLSAIMWRLARTDAYPVFSSEISVLFRDWCELMRTKPCLPVSALVHALGTYIHSCKSVPSYLHSWYIHLFICIHGTFIYSFSA